MIAALFVHKNGTYFGLPIPRTASQSPRSRGQHLPLQSEKIMGKKVVPQTAEAYAKHLYMWSKCTGTYVGTMNDFAVIDCRVRAFIDGVNWQKRKARSQHCKTYRRMTMVERFKLASTSMVEFTDGSREFVRASDYDAQVEENERLRAKFSDLGIRQLLERIAQLEAALTWVLANFNTFEQPPEHLKSIVDDACLKAMTADEDAVRMTAEARRSAPETACDCAGPVGPAGQHEPGCRSL